MTKERFWQTIQLDCPETRARSRLLADWVDTERGWHLQGLSCSHPRLRDLGGPDCGWSCWTLIRQRRRRPPAL